MKNSAWYYKLWRKKLNNLPVNGDADAGWAKMRQMLDDKLPADKPNGARMVKPLVTKLVTFFGYVLPAAAMIGTATYFVAPKLTRHTVDKTRTKHARHIQKKLSDANILKKDSTFISKDSSAVSLDANRASNSRVYTDSLTAQMEIVSGTNDQAARKLSNVKNSRSNLVSAAVKNGLLEKPFTKKNKEASSLQRIISGQSSKGFINKGVKGNSYLNVNKQIYSRYYVTKEQNDSTVSADFDRKEILVSHFTAPGLSAAVIHTGTVQNRLAVVELKNDKITRFGDKKSFSQKGFREKELKPDIITPIFNYGIEVGINTSSVSNNLYAGFMGSYALNKRWLVGSGLRINTLKTLSGTYSHHSYFRLDSASSFSINDVRKVLVFDVPANLAYKINNWLSLQAGPVISFNIKQLNAVTEFGPISNGRDTLYYGKQIDSAIKATSINKMTIGFSGGANLQFKHFSLNTRYQLLSPYKVTNSIGTYQKTYPSFQLGVSYHFK
jgi:hypothetical protein